MFFHNGILMVFMALTVTPVKPAFKMVFNRDAVDLNTPKHLVSSFTVFPKALNLSNMDLEFRRILNTSLPST